jgi:hypothetical protein
MAVTFFSLHSLSPFPFVDLIDGQVKRDRCCKWIWLEDWTLNRDLQTFITDSSIVIQTSDTEINSRHKSTAVEGFKADNDCGKFLCTDKSKVTFLPVKVGEIFPNLIAYQVRMFAVQSVMKKNFVGLSKLELLYLDNNAIRTIDDNAFDDLWNLKVLNLNYNKLGSVKQEWFRDLLSLERLNLGANSLSTISAAHIGHLTKLTIFVIDDNNFARLDRDTFLRLTSLKTIWMRRNKVLSLDEEIFANLRELEDVSLFSNQLTTLPAKIFDNNKKLKSIHLDKNKLEQLSSRLFNDKPDLGWVNIQGNPCIDKAFGTWKAGAIERTLTDEERMAMRDEVEAKCGVNESKLKF